MTEIILDEHEDWDKRILCSDESCIGTIGADGKCKECGKAHEGALPEGHGGEAVPPQAIEASREGVPEVAESDDDWENRVLCSDGSCIGVIGPDGKCNECGKPL